MNRHNYILIICVAMSLSSCFKDKGNYDYVDINELKIAAHGFDDTVYNMRADMDRLTIKPTIAATLDPQMTHTYEYQWVAVGKVKYPGKRFELSTERDLSYDVRLPAESYDLYLKVKDLTTDLVFSKSAELTVSTAYSRGWLLASQDEQEHAVVDMISISRDTLVQFNIVKGDNNVRTEPRLIWVDNDIYTSQQHGRVYFSTAEGSYMYERETMSYDGLSNMKNYFVNSSYVSKAYATFMNQIDDKERIFIVDGNAYSYSISSLNIGHFGNPINRYAGQYDINKIGDKAAMNFRGKGAAAVTNFGLYNTDKKCFSTGTRFDEFIKDNADTESDIGIYTWNTGLDYVTTINSMFASGQSATVLKDDQQNHFIYTYTIGRGGCVKGGRYAVGANATDFDKATCYSMTSRHGYMIYAVGGILYGYDFRAGKGAVVLKDYSPAVITTLHNDIFTGQKDEDFIYVATYADGRSRSGKIRKYTFVDTADRIEMTEQKDVRWDNLNRVKDMFFKEM